MTSDQHPTDRTRILDDADWIHLLRRSDDSDFGPDGRGPLEALIVETASLMGEDRSLDGVSSNTARRWLAEFDEVVEESGFQPGPVCQVIAARCWALVPSEPKAAVRPAMTASELAVPLADTEWLELLNDSETNDNGMVLGVLTEMVQVSPGIDISLLRTLWYAVEDVLDESPAWRPGPLLSRLLAQAVEPERTLISMRNEIADLRGLAGIVPSDDPTAPWR